MPLSSNYFKSIVGAAYISKVDGAPGATGTKSNPFKELGDVVDANQTDIVIRSSPLYPDSDFVMDTTRNIHGDGAAKIYGGNGIAVMGDDGGGSTIGHRYHTNVEYYGMPQFRGNRQPATGGGHVFQNCKIHNTITCEYGGNISADIDKLNEYVDISNLLHEGLDIISEAYFQQNLYKNTNHTFSKGTSSQQRFYSRCIFHSGNFITAGVADNSVISWSNCAFGVGMLLNSTGIKLDGDASDILLQYADGQKFSGNITIGNKTIVLLNCFWTANFRFNGESVGDYTPSAIPNQSILFNGGNIIGPHNVHQKITFDHPAFSAGNGAVLVDTYVSGSDLRIEDTFDTGTIESTKTDVNSAIVPVTNVRSTDSIKVFGETNDLTGEFSDLENYDDPTNLEVRRTCEIAVYNGVDFSDNKEHELFNILGIEEDGVLGNGDVDVNVNNLTPRNLDNLLSIKLNLRQNGVID